MLEVFGCPPNFRRGSCFFLLFLLYKIFFSSYFNHKKNVHDFVSCPNFSFGTGSLKNTQSLNDRGQDT